MNAYAIQALGEKLDQIHAVCNRVVSAEANREQVVDRLHAELQEYKNDLHMKLLRPVFIDLIQLHDEIGKMADPHVQREGATAGVLETMRSVQQEIEDILYRQGVEPYLQPGETFDPRRQRAIATTPTNDPVLHKSVATRHRKGFQTGDKVIRPEMVTVYAYERPAKSRK